MAVSVRLIYTIVKNGSLTEEVNFFLGELLGRRRAIILAMVLISIGAVLQAASFGLAELFLGRVITGLGTGMKSSTVPS